MSKCYRIQPVEVTDANLVSSNVAEDDYPEWNGTTPFGVSGRCIVLATHSVYESLIDNNLDQYPPDYVKGMVEVPSWILVDSTNRHRMFDQAVGSRTVMAEAIEVAITPGRINSLVVLDAVAANVAAWLVDPVYGEVWRSEVSMVSNAGTNNIYRYLFDPLATRNAMLIDNIPPYAAATLYVTISAPGGTAECGKLAFGWKRFLGKTQWGLQSSIDNYSLIETDKNFGVTRIVPGDFADLVSCDLKVNNSDISATRRELVMARSTPAVFVVTDLYDFGMLYGLYESFKIILPGPVMSDCSLELRGIVNVA